jgi:UDP-N-acetylglucosamine--dolichyl-phosphate N-acetylglucosaminephosphotransferase
LYLSHGFPHNLPQAGLFGVDLNKSSGEKVPEATGVIAGCVFLMITFLMIPATYSDFLLDSDHREAFPHQEFTQLLAALLSISCMLLLGFADDVLDLRWRHKLLLPSMASLPLLMVYYVTTNRTEIMVPTLLRSLLGSSIQLGVLYYVYMGMLAVFCTNAINILAGINGLEVGQSVIIAGSLVIFNLMSLSGNLGHRHEFSLYFLLPYLGTSLGLLAHNWFPSRVFPGDTFCYFSGMTLAVVAILGHFSKTLLLFFLPQIANFLYSCPQLFHLVPCPRHRLPKYCRETDTVSMSLARFPASSLRLPGRLSLALLGRLGLAHVVTVREEGQPEMVECNNLTLINFALKLTGPLHERTVTVVLLGLQLLCTAVAFTVRYPLAFLLFGEVAA